MQCTWRVAWIGSRILLGAAVASGTLVVRAQVPAVQEKTATQAATSKAAQPAAGDLVHALVASDALARGDVDAWMQEVVGLLSPPNRGRGAADEAALIMLAHVTGSLREPRAWLDALSRLDSANDLDPHARAYLSDLLRDQRIRRMDHAALERARGSDQYPDRIAAFRVLGPLAGPDPKADGEDLFADPGFERAHTGLRGARVSWRAGRRDNLRRDVALAEWLEPVEGWALIAFEFDLPRAQPAAIEIDARGFFGRRMLPYLMSAERPWRSATGDPTWMFAVNGAAPTKVDPVAAEIDPVVLAPSMLRAGRNRVLVWCDADAHPDFSLRVLVPERNDGSVCAGRPLDLSASNAPDLDPRKSALGPASPGNPPRIAGVAARLPREKPQDKALLGQFLIVDARPIEGLALLRAASEEAPGDFALEQKFARALHDSPYLPESWRRSAARTRLESLASRGRHMEVDLRIASTQAHEDHEEDALLGLERARQEYVASPDPLLELARVYPQLEMSLAAEKARDAAFALAPHAGDVLELVADERSSDGLHARAVELRQSLAHQVGADASAMASLSAELSAAGDADGALDALQDANLRSGGRGYTQQLADFLFERERFEEADALFARLVEMYPRWTEPLLRRAEVAHRRGDATREKALLDQVLAISPSSTTARARMNALGVPDPTEALFARWRADRAAVMASYDPKRWSDSVVRVLDSQVLRVFADGSFETLTHDILQVKDLDGCKRQGDQRMAGRVEKIVTIKAGDGSELEPVEVEGKYVMPSLKPGDFIERVFREARSAPEEGMRVLGSWRFASAEEPYHISRFVVVLPRGHGFELYEHDFDGTHDVFTEGGLDGGVEIHVFEVRDRDRLQHEPGAPPVRWLVPWVQFGKHWDVAAESRRILFQQARLATRVTPEVRAFAQRALESLPAKSGAGGAEVSEEARAIALYDAVRLAVKKPSTKSNLSATATLLGETGNPAYLFASVLSASGIEHELVWSSDTTPECDPERDEPFPSPDRWDNRLLVIVKPKGASPAWCDLSVRDMPYGKLIANAPRAEALTRSGVVHLPDVAPEDGPGIKISMEIDVQADGSATASLRQDRTGNLGYLNKDRFKETPEARRKADIGRFFGSVLQGFELTAFESPGIDDDQPLALVARGRVSKFLDETSDGFTAKLPLPAAGLTQALAGGEGERKLPYHFRTPFMSISTVEIRLPEGLRLAEAPPPTQETWHGCVYDLAVDTSTNGVVKLTRKIVLAPFLIPPDEYAGFAAFCARGDEIERVPLRFAR